MGGVSVGLSVCEDAWHPGRPFAEYRGVPLVDQHQRLAVPPAASSRSGSASSGIGPASSAAWIAYVNAVGGQDELVFDGGSMVMGPDGEVACRAAMFDEDLLIVDVDDDAARAEHDAAWPEPPESIYRALVLGLRRLRAQERVRRRRPRPLGRHRLGVRRGARGRRARRRRGPRARDALAVLEPRERRGRGRRRRAARHPARRRADRRGVRRLPIDARGRCSRTAPRTSPRRTCRRGSRGNLLMALSNKFGSLVLATGNKSEYAVGYATLYGDMAGGFAPIKDVPKTLVYELCRVAERRRARRTDPRAGADEAAVRGAPARTRRTRTRSRRTRRSTRSSRPTSRTTSASTRSSPRGHDRATVERGRPDDRPRRVQAAPGRARRSRSRRRRSAATAGCRSRTATWTDPWRPSRARCIAPSRSRSG